MSLAQGEAWLGIVYLPSFERLFTLRALVAVGVELTSFHPFCSYPLLY